MAHSTLKIAGALVLSSATACTEVVPLAWKLPAEAQSLVYGWPVDGEAPQLAAQAASDPLPIVHLNQDPLYAVSFKQSLEALALPAGPFRERNGRTWPDGAEAMVLRPGAEAFVAITLDELKAELGERVLPALGPTQCAQMEGCYAYALPGPAVCEAPCVRPLEPEAPRAPAAPALPVLAICAGGWRPREVELVAVCDPPEPAACPTGARRGWAAGCLPLGEDCPAAPFPTLSGPVYYVTAGGPAGDGSLNNPFNGIAAALATVPDGATLALGEGRFEFGLTTTASVTVVGLCAARTTLVAPTGVSTLTLSPGAWVELRNLSCEGDAGAATLSSEGDLRLRGVELRGGAHSLEARGGSVQARELRVFGASEDALVFDGALVSLEGVDVAGRGGLHLAGTIPAQITDYWSEANAGIVLDDGARLTLSRGLIRGHQGWAVRGGLGVTLTTQDLYVDGAQGGRGIWLGRGAELTGDRLHLVATSSAAIRIGPIVDDQQRRLDGLGELRDLVIEGALERGVVAVDVRLHTARTLSSGGTGIAFDVPFGESLLEDLSAVDIAEIPGIGFGSAVIADRALLRVARARVDGCQWHGIRAFSDFGSIGSAELEDVSISGAVYFGVTASVPMLAFRRVAIRGGVGGVGITSTGDWKPVGEYSDLSIHEVMGPGLSLYTGQAEVNRVLVERSRGAAISLDQVTVRGSDFRVDGIPIEGGSPAFQGNALALGPAVVKGDLEFAAIELERFFFHGTGRAGIWLGDNADATFRNGWIEGFQVGVFASRQDYARDQELTGVRFAEPQPE